MHLSWLLFFGMFWLVAIVGLALLVTWVVRSRPLSATTQPPTRETPLDILARRFAAGEIDADEYKRARDILSGGSTT